MHIIRERVKEHFPTVLLTLLSIVQALALELLWGYRHEAYYLYEWTWFAMLAWGQVIATLTGFILIWVVYAGNVMRFRWVPAVGDSVVPFVIGLLEFMMIETLNPNKLGYWLIYTGVVYAAMIWTSHVTLRRARQEPDNSTHFQQWAASRNRDFYPEIAIVAGFMAVGAYIVVSKNTGWVALLAVCLANGIILWRFYSTAVIWNRSISEDSI
ncbi:MAG: hypothetical protein KUG75_08145 [Pseudomonadales bacterium]|nr:hypothetical protein [Pseudomonadales bacterium]